MEKIFHRFLLVALAAMLIGIPIFLEDRIPDVDPNSQLAIAAPLEIIEVPARRPKLSAAANEWIDSLQWCESRDDPTQINEVDRDGTPSYYAFQFKPGTFRLFGEAYGVIEKDLPEGEIMELMKDTDIQRAIVGFMVLDPTTNWEQQFPDCVRRLGRPPMP